MSWENVLKNTEEEKPDWAKKYDFGEKRANQVKEALLLWFKDEEDLYDSNWIDKDEKFTSVGISNLIEDLKFAMSSDNYDPKRDTGLPKAIKALERLL